MSSSALPHGGEGARGAARRRGAARAERSRRAILEAAARLFVENRGASMQEVAEEAGVGRTTVHNLFRSRDELIRAIALDALAECGAAIEAARPHEGPVAEAVQRLAEGLVPVGERYAFLLAEGQVEDDPEFREDSERVDRPVEELIERGRRDGTFGADAPLAWIGGALEALVYAAWEGVRKGEIARNDAPRLVARTLLSGLGTAGEWPAEPEDERRSR